MEDIQKNFGNISAIKNGFFDLYEGEIHSLIGENGAGKSTMMKILYGLYPKDGGRLSVKGKEYEEYSTKTAIELGIGMVHQHFMLVEAMTVLENIILGDRNTKGIFIDKDARRRERRLTAVRIVRAAQVRPASTGRGSGPDDGCESAHA